MSKEEGEEHEEEKEGDEKEDEDEDEGEGNLTTVNNELWEVVSEHQQVLEGISSVVGEIKEERSKW